MAILMVIAVGVNLDLIINAEGFKRICIIFYIELESIFILENSTTIDMPIPNKFRNVLVQLKEDD